MSDVKFGTPIRNVVWLDYPTQAGLCDAFCRLQEFYESPYAEIKGRVFTRVAFEARYAADHGGVFTYLTDWHGFNVPGAVMHLFFEDFPDITEAEEEINWAARVIPAGEDFYIIGTHGGGTELSHELAHALWYLNGSYRTAALHLVSRAETRFPVAVGALRQWLTDEGYAPEVMLDELNAYLATTPVEYWQDELPLHAHELHAAGYVLRALYEEELLNAQG